MSGTQFDLDKFNNLVAQATSALSCGTDCQKSAKAERLHQKYLTAKDNITSAPTQLEVAERNYVTFTEGELAYDELQDRQLMTKAALVSDQYTATFDQQAAATRELMRSSDALQMNQNNVKELADSLRRENGELARELRQERSSVFTNERRTEFENQGIDQLGFYYTYVLWTVYVICVIGFLVTGSPFGRVKKAAIFVGLCLLPFVSTWLLGCVVWLAYWLYGFVPRNVYGGSTT